MENEIEEIKKELDDLCNTIAPSKVVLDIGQYQTTHANKILKEYGRFVSQFELYYDLIVETFHAVNYIDKAGWPKHRSVQFLLFVHNLKSLYSSFERLIHGFYEDSIILARPVYEAFIKSIFITCNPKEPYAVFAKRFNLSNFLKDNLRLDWHAYGLFSGFAHANKYSVLKEATGIYQEKQKEAITLKFQFDQKLFEVGVNYISYLLLIYLKAIVTLFATNSNHILKKEMIEKTERLIYLRERGFSLHPKDYWPKIIKDTKDIFEMVRKTELGNNWVDVWKEIRGI